MLALDEGYEGFGWRVFESGRTLGAGAEGEPREVAPRLLQRSGGADQRRRADVLHDQRDHEPLRAVAAGRELLGHRHRALRRVFALSRRDPPDRSTRARAVAARAIAAGIPRSHDAASSSPSWDATATWPATASRTTAAATSPAVACGSWRLERACRRASAASARSGPWMSRRPSRRFSASRWWNAKAGRSPSSPSEYLRRADVGAGAQGSLLGNGARGFSRATMQFNPALIGEAATLARTHGEMLAHLPATVHAFILVELQKWPTLFQPEQRYQRALLEHLSRLPKSALDSATAGIARIEGTGRRRPRSPIAIPPASRMRRRRCCDSAGCRSPGAARSTGFSGPSIRRSRPGSIPPMHHGVSSFRSMGAALRSSATNCGAASKAPASACRWTWTALRAPNSSSRQLLGARGW